MINQETFKKSVRLGPLGDSSCPHCNNSLENGKPSDRPDLRRCANCKSIFIPMNESKNDKISVV